jgi:hypothetical protein
MATANIKPNSDETTQWDTTTGVDHYTEIDEGAPYNDASYIETQTVGDVDEFGLESVPANTSQVTALAVNYRGQIDDAGATAKVRLELTHSGGTPVTGNPKDVTGADLGGYGVLGTVVKTWSGLTLTRAQANTLQLKATFLAS